MKTAAMILLLAATPIGAAFAMPTSPPAETLSPPQAVLLAAERAPDGVPGVFALQVRATGEERGKVFLNSEQDYRDQRNLTIVLSPAANASLAVRLDRDPREVLVGQQIRVTGIAHRVTVYFTDRGKRTDKYYFQTHVDVFDAAQVELVSAPAAATVPAASEAALPPGASVGGRSAADLAGDWWQWAMASPGDDNPVRDETGEHCAVDQGGDVWFLAGGFGSSRITRRCRVPAGKHLFFPIVNSVYYPRRDGGAYTCDEAKADAVYANDGTLDLFATVDGVPVAAPKQFRATTATCFDAFARVPADAGAYRAYPSATDGFWLLLKPLAKGTHRLTFGGRQMDARSGNNRTVQDIVYEIVVE